MGYGLFRSVLYVFPSDLLSRLRDARKADGSTEHVGHILTDWVGQSLGGFFCVCAALDVIVDALPLVPAGALSLLLHLVLL